MVESLRRKRVLASDVDETLLCPGRETGDRQRLDQSDRVLLHQDPVLERPRLGLVGVADEVVRTDRVARYGLPFRAGGVRRAAAAAELGVGELADHAFRSQTDRRPQRFIPTLRAIVVEVAGIDDTDPTKQPALRWCLVDGV